MPFQPYNIIIMMLQEWAGGVLQLGQKVDITKRPETYTKSTHQTSIEFPAKIWRERGETWGTTLENKKNLQKTTVSGLWVGALMQKSLVPPKGTAMAPIKPTYRISIS